MKKSLDKLKPRTFCGGEVYILTYEKNIDFEIDTHSACCRECGIQTPDGIDKKEVIKVWNTRVQTQVEED